MGLFLAPNSLAPGGVSGVAVLLERVFPIGAGSLIVLLNLPLLAVSMVKWGSKFTLSTLGVVAVSGAVADWASLFSPITVSPILASVFGGILLGLGYGFTVRGGGTTGGTDIVSRLLKIRFSHLKFTTLLLIVDGIISILSGIVSKNSDTAMYSLIALGVSVKVIDMIVYGLDGAKLVLAVSTKCREIADGLVYGEDVGCTILNGVSGYRRQQTEILMCAVKKQYFPHVRDYILRVDGGAFMLVANAGEIFGEGFKLKSDIF